MRASKCHLLTWAQLGLHRKPILLLDVEHYWTPLETLLRHVVNYLHRHPPSTDASESNYHLYVICERMTQAETLSTLQQLLESSGYPARSIEKHSLGASDTEIEVLLFATIAKSDELNAITAKMEQSPGVKGAFWHTSPLIA